MLRCSINGCLRLALEEGKDAKWDKFSWVWGESPKCFSYNLGKVLCDERNHIRTLTQKIAE